MLGKINLLLRLISFCACCVSLLMVALGRLEFKSQIVILIAICICDTILIWFQSNSRTYLMYFTYVMVTACWLAAYFWDETLFGAIAIFILMIYMPRYGISLFMKEDS